jgi:hypothetical protein
MGNALASFVSPFIIEKLKKYFNKLDIYFLEDLSSSLFVSINLPRCEILCKYGINSSYKLKKITVLFDLNKVIPNINIEAMLKDNN